MGDMEKPMRRLTKGWSPPTLNAAGIHLVPRVERLAIVDRLKTYEKRGIDF